MAYFTETDEDFDGVRKGAEVHIGISSTIWRGKVAKVIATGRSPQDDEDNPFHPIAKVEVEGWLEKFGRGPRLFRPDQLTVLS